MNKILTPFQKFVKIESFSGFLLIIATFSAIVLANSPLNDWYQNLWQYKIGFYTPFFELKKPLILWINDGLMAIFFFLIGLEIKREFLLGELNSLKKISFPLAGAVGGMIVPVLFYILLNNNAETANAWGISMATDIAFSLAILTLLGNKVPLGLKLFLTAFAIIDDLGAVVVIALFYSGQIDFSLLIYAFLLIGILSLIAYKRHFSTALWLTIGIIVWILFLKAGIHPTLAGIFLAFTVPIRQKITTENFKSNLENIVSKISKSKVLPEPILSNEQINTVYELESWTKKFRSPLQHLEHKLHNWIAYFIIPVFAFANAGVNFTDSGNLDINLMIVIIISLLAGKSVGVSLFVFVTSKLKWITIPGELCKIHIIGVSFLAGIGFTMSIFIASLAFNTQPDYLASAKIGILIGSLLAAIIGYLILNRSHTKCKHR